MRIIQEDALSGRLVMDLTIVVYKAQFEDQLKRVTKYTYFQERIGWSGSLLYGLPLYKSLKHSKKVTAESTLLSNSYFHTYTSSVYSSTKPNKGL